MSDTISYRQAAGVLEALYLSYQQVAHSLCAHIRLENDLLFADRGKEFLLDRAVIRQRNALIENYQHASSELVNAFMQQPQGSDVLRERLIGSLSEVQHLMHLNQTLLGEEIASKEQRIDAIMKRIDALDEQLMSAASSFDGNDRTHIEDHCHVTH